MPKTSLPFFPAMATVQDWKSSDLECCVASPCLCFRYGSLFSNDHSNSTSHRECTCLSMGVLDIFIAMFSQIQNLLSDDCIPSASKAAIIHIFDVASTNMSCFPLQNVMAFLLLCWAETLFFSGSGSHGIPKLCGVWRRYWKSFLLFVNFKQYFLGTSVWQSSANIPFQYTFRIFSS